MSETKMFELNETAYRLLRDDALNRLNRAVIFTTEWTRSVEEIKRHHVALGEAIARYDECERLYQETRAGATK